MKNKILNKFKELGNGISFADLSHIEGFEGDFMYGFPDKNVYFWFSCSEEAIDALEELISEGTIVLKPTVELVYLVDGIMPRNKKIAKRIRPYVDKRWLPVVLNRV